jgi:hypothetical protein
MFHSCWLDFKNSLQLRWVGNYSVLDVHTQNLHFINILQLISFILLKLITIHFIFFKSQIEYVCHKIY